MSLLVVNKGWLCTVQDLGRPGFGQYGINRSGAMDPLALQVGNYLVGNPGNFAALEMCFPAPEFLFLEPALIVLAGADFGANLDGNPLAVYQPAWVPAGTTLTFQHKKQGQYLYLCIQGGLDIEPWLSSQSTHLKAKQGGWKGQNLQKAEVLPLKNQIPAAKVPTLVFAKYRANLSGAYLEPAPLHILRGQHFEQLNQASQALLFTQNWQISAVSDRMGYRLEGRELELNQEESLLSAGISRGSIQLPPNGQPIVLMADHQTTGGYPIIGQLIQTDWHRLAQLGPGARLRFQEITLAEANDFLKAQLQWLKQIRRSTAWALKAFNQG